MRSLSWLQMIGKAGFRVVAIISRFWHCVSTGLTSIWCFDGLQGLFTEAFFILSSNVELVHNTFLYNAQKYIFEEIFISVTLLNDHNWYRGHLILKVIVTLIDEWCVCCCTFSVIWCDIRISVMNKHAVKLIVAALLQARVQLHASVCCFVRIVDVQLSMRRVFVSWW